MTDQEMFNQAPMLARLAASCLKVCEKASAVVKKIAASGDLKIIYKNGDITDVQTECDRAAQYCIRKSLESTFGPSLTIIGEEEKESEVHELETGFSIDVLKHCNKLPDFLQNAKIEDFVIWVDPLDGTKEFSEGIQERNYLLEQVTMLIGIGHNPTQRAVAGIINQPFFGFAPDRDYSHLGRSIWSVCGCGVHGIDLKDINAKSTLVLTRSHLSKSVQETRDSLIAAGLIQEVVKVGGAGYKILRIISGDHAYVHASIGTKKWDTCAPEAVLIEAGGKVTDALGNALKYDHQVEHMNSAGVVATAPSLNHQAFIDAISKNIKESLLEIKAKN